MRPVLKAVVVLAGITSMGLITRAQQVSTRYAEADQPGTFSILGFDPETGDIGGAVQSKVFSVGNGVLWVEDGIGAVATQAAVDVGYGPKGMALLKTGMAPKDIIQKIWTEDPDDQVYKKAGRQFAVMNMKGEVAAFTGPAAPVEAADAQGKYCSAQGNTLGRPDKVWPPADGPKPSKVPAAMVKAFEDSEKTADGRRNHLSMRLLMAIEAGQAAGGDHRGQQSAALIVAKKNCGVWPHNDIVLRLQVDDSPEPIKELRRLVEKALAARYLVPCYRR
jgi:uncharacterized Ntn-hydrolase superfamily protein